jgi:hypothetical protein
MFTTEKEVHQLSKIVPVSHAELLLVANLSERVTFSNTISMPLALKKNKKFHATGTSITQVLTRACTFPQHFTMRFQHL